MGNLPIGGFWPFSGEGAQGKDWSPDEHQKACSLAGITVVIFTAQICNRPILHWQGKAKDDFWRPYFATLWYCLYRIYESIFVAVHAFRNLDAFLLLFCHRKKT